MLLMKGTKRVFETPTAEDTSSTASNRAITLYGVTSYDDIINSLIHIRALVGGTEGAATLNINNLGNKSIKIYKSGMKQNLPGNWVSIGQIYTIYYDGTDFVLDGNYDRIDSSDTTAFEMNLDDFLNLTENSTSAQITEAFGGEEGIQKFKTALNYGTVSAFRSSEDNTTTYTCILRNSGASANDFDMVRFVGQGSEDDAINASTEITLMFMIGEGNTYSRVIKSEKNLFNTASNAFEIPVEVLSLSSKSTAADITAALGGADNVALFEQAILTKSPLTIAQAGDEYFRIDVNNLVIQLEQSGNKTVVTQVTLEMVNISVPEIIVLTLAKSDKTASFDTADLVHTEIGSKYYVDSRIKATSDSIVQDLPEQLYMWAFGDETSYPPETPDENTLTAYMTSAIQTMLENFVTKGIIVRAANILSGADRKSYYSNLYVVYKDYSSSEPRDYDYYFKPIVGTKDFYVYWDNSESKWYWNQKGAITAIVCFTGDTEVLTPTGLNAIENLCVGDEVTSYNFNTQKIETKSITKLASHEETIIYTIHTTNGDIRTTGDHPFYAVELGEVLAMNLSIVNRLMNSRGEIVEITGITKQVTDPIMVYEIAVEDNHNYFVGKDSVLVFNETCMRN